MTTEQKIKEAFDVHKRSMDIEDSPQFVDFRAGYLALLNSLEPTGVFARNKEREQVMTYRLPEGVTKP